jgi:hypothetical protein
MDLENVLLLLNSIFLNKGHYCRVLRAYTHARVYVVVLHFPPPNATTCPLWTSWSPLPVVAKVYPTSEVGTPMRRSYVVPMRWMVIYEYKVPGGTLNLSSTKLLRPWSPWGSSPSRKNPHGRTWDRTRDLIGSQKL